MKRSVKDGIRHATKMKAVGRCTVCGGRGYACITSDGIQWCAACDATGRGDIQRQKGAAS